MNEQKRKALYLLKLQDQLETLILNNISSAFLDDTKDKVISKLNDASYAVQRLAAKACKEVK